MAENLPLLPDDYVLHPPGLGAQRQSRFRTAERSAVTPLTLKRIEPPRPREGDASM